MRNAPQRYIAVALFTLTSLVGWVACSPNATTTVTPPVSADRAGPKKHQKRPGQFGAISHIFIIIQENRTLNNLFAGANIPGANTTTTGEEVTSSGVEQPIALQPQSTIATQEDIDHCYFDAAAAINASGSRKPMDGFNNETAPGGCPGTKLAGKKPYAYIQQSQALQPLWDLAHNWVLAANYYPTELGPSFVAHLNLIAGTTEIKPQDAVADFPEGGAWGCANKAGHNVRTFGPGTPYATPGPYDSGPPCYNQFHSIADILDCIYCGTSSTYSAVQWRYYAPALNSNPGNIWSAFQAIKRVYNGNDWKNDVISPDWQVLKDIPAGKLDNVGVTWVVPEFIWSDHAGPGLKDWGPSWVGNIVNAIGERPALWQHSVIVVLWDDWGGWYDPAAPPNLDFRGLGIRTPMMIISPYDPPQAAAGYDVSEEQFQSGSVLKFIEQVFFNGETLGSLPCKDGSYYYSYGCSLGYTDGTDSKTKSIGDVLNTSLPPRPYVPIQTKYPPSKFEKSGYYYTDDLPPDNE